MLRAEDIGARARPVVYGDSAKNIPNLLCCITRLLKALIPSKPHEFDSHLTYTLHPTTRQQMNL